MPVAHLRPWSRPGSGEVWLYLNDHDFHGETERKIYLSRRGASPGRGRVTDIFSRANWQVCAAPPLDVLQVGDVRSAVRFAIERLVGRSMRRDTDVEAVQWEELAGIRRGGSPRVMAQAQQELVKAIRPPEVRPRRPFIEDLSAALCDRWPIRQPPPPARLPTPVLAEDVDASYYDPLPF